VRGTLEHASQEKELLAEHLDAKEETNLVHKALDTLGQLVWASPRVNGNGVAWKKLADTAEAERVVLCKHMDGKALFTAILRLHAATHREMLSSLVKTTEGDPAQDIDEEFREQKRRKLVLSDGSSNKAKKTATAAPAPKDPRIKPQGEVLTKKYFTHVRTTEMDVECPVVEGSTQQPDGEPQQQSTSKSGRPPLIVLTSPTTNLMQLQRKFKGVVVGSFRFRNTRKGTRIVTKEMADFSAIKTFLEEKKLSYFTFSPKSENPSKP
jgi:hypothetical protein